ncbi:hypothetical protein [Demequina mangrovi]|uniref:Lipoprotein n=1 Tax=Demequina mangrovi TaxID=1043493 RepID=A0A1H6UKQ4_9MICO|nr:hypothetical protein [Demequina mangrovi]SEI92266.1 hypothetical protein SAMN05421637_0424 [Demequina mangrovi]
MRINDTVKATMLAAATALVLVACSSDSDGDASAEASAPAAEATPDVAGTVAAVKDAIACDGSWAGGKMAGSDVLVGWQYTCDTDGDGVAEGTLSIYPTAEALDSDLANVEGAATDTGIVEGDRYLYATSDPDQFAAVSGLGGEVVREIP